MAGRPRSRPRPRAGARAPRPGDFQRHLERWPVGVGHNRSLTSKGRPLRSHLRIVQPEGGLPQVSYIICDQIRTISTLRLGKHFGHVSPAVLAAVEERLKYLIDLK